MARSPFGYAEKPIRLTEIIVAPYDELAQTYGVPDSASGPQTLSPTPNIVTDVQQIAGRDADMAALLQSYAISAGLTGIDISIFKIITGGREEANPQANDTRSNFYQSDAGDGDPGYPPFGIIGVGSAKNGVFTCGFPKVVVESMGAMEMTGTGVAYAGMDFTGRALFEDVRADDGDPFAKTIRRFRNRSDFVAPETAEAFKAYFTENLSAMPPSAAFSHTNSAREYTFTDNSMGTPTSWFWEFGDSYFSTLQNPKHEYAAAGEFTVRLTVRNKTGSSTTTESITVP